MFDIRKIQEDVIYHSVKAESNADIANEVVYGKEQFVNAESNPDWVKSAMHRCQSPKNLFFPLYRSGIIF